MVSLIRLGWTVDLIYFLLESLLEFQLNVFPILFHVRGAGGWILGSHDVLVNWNLSAQ